MSPEQKDVIVTRLTDNIPLIVKAFCVILISACTATTAWAVLRNDVQNNKGDILECAETIEGLEAYSITMALRLRKLEDANLASSIRYQHILDALEDIKEQLNESHK